MFAFGLSKEFMHGLFTNAFETWSSRVRDIAKRFLYFAYQLLC